MCINIVCDVGLNIKICHCQILQAFSPKGTFLRTNFIIFSDNKRTCLMNHCCIKMKRSKILMRKLHFPFSHPWSISSTFYAHVLCANVLSFYCQSQNETREKLSKKTFVYEKGASKMMVKLTPCCC